MRRYIKNRVKLWELIQFKVSNQYLSPSELYLISAVVCTVFVYRNESTFIKLQKESLQKDVGQELLAVNNSV